MKDILLFGMPGAGKGTQANLLLEHNGNQHNYSHLSTGDIFRWLTSNTNAIGNHITNHLQAWNLVDDDVTIHIFKAYFFAVVNDKQRMLIDWYPRTLRQMYALVNMMHYHQRDLLGIQFKLSDEQAIERMMARARPGETQSIMETRLKEYHDKTFPLLDAFSQHFDLITIDASGSIDEIHAEVMKIVWS